VITFEEAIRIVDGQTQAIGKEIALTALRGRVLAGDVHAAFDSPPFDNSAVDGYGRRAEDLGKEALPLCGSVQAGDDGRLVVPGGAAVRILTGAPVPPGVAAVSMQEDCVESDGIVRFREASEPGDNIRAAGSDFRKGDLLLRQGTRLNSAGCGLLASAGVTAVEVTTRPRITILTTGNELVEPEKALAAGQIYNSNAVALQEFLRSLSARVHLRHCPDDPEAILTEAAISLERDDVLVTCGGVSVGSYDFVKDVFAAAGIVQRFWGVAIKPGKPLYFGTCGHALVFGLPGNPVSALVTSYLFVRPALLKLQGHPDPWGRPRQARFEGSARKKPGRLEFLRGDLSPEGLVREAGEQGSHQLAALAVANCLIHFPAEATKLMDGDLVQVTPLDW